MAPATPLHSQVPLEEENPRTAGARVSHAGLADHSGNV